MVRDIVHDPFFLGQISEAATEDDIQVAVDLLDTLRAHLDGCVGMAANMIGVRKSIIAVSAGIGQFVMINPVIVSRKKPYNTEEGCYSLLGGPRPCRRYEEIEVEYLDMNFKPLRRKYTGYIAEIIQHEVDHINGVLI